VTLEAMACGLPVVCAAATGSESLVSDGVSGRLIPPGHINAFAQAVRAYVEDPELRKALARRANCAAAISRGTASTRPWPTPICG
jgi:glycosyltransferase involved in cell wall biosynthesis